MPGGFLPVGRRRKCYLKHNCIRSSSVGEPALVLAYGVKERKEEAECFARSRLGDSNQVAAFDCNRPSNAVASPEERALAEAEGSRLPYREVTGGLLQSPPSHSTPTQVSSCREWQDGIFLISTGHASAWIGDGPGKAAASFVRTVAANGYCENPADGVPSLDAPAPPFSSFFFSSFFSFFSFFFFFFSFLSFFAFFAFFASLTTAPAAYFCPEEREKRKARVRLGGKICAQ